MDYEKKYNEALKRAKAAIDIAADKDLVKGVATTIFPELRESEDERIRQFLVKHVSEWIGCIEHDLKISSKDVESEEELAMFKAGLAWLEKQKERNPAQTVDEKEYIRTIKSIISDFIRDKQPEDVAFYQKIYDWLDGRYIEQKPADDKAFEEWIDGWFKEHKEKACPQITMDEKEFKNFCRGIRNMYEQKPNLSDGEIEDNKRDIVAAIRKFYSTDYAEYLTSFLKGLSPEDNSEDQYGQEMLAIAYKLMYEYIPENLRTQEFWNSLKFMREYTGKVAIIHSYEKPVEWSEEEKNGMFSDIILAIRAFYMCGREDLVEYFKSLRPQQKAELTLLDENIIEAAVAFVEQNDHFNVWRGVDKHTVIKALRTIKPHWKPSAEQMDALLASFKKDEGVYDYYAIESLYNDLQKLL